MKAKITIDLDSAAFDNEPGAELGRILRGLADEFSTNRRGHPAIGNNAPLYDINSNQVGEFKVTR